MIKTGRNDPCPCGSGRKFKQCCAGKPRAVATEGSESAIAARPSLQAEVEKVWQRARDRQASLHTVGLFTFFTTVEGDGWLLEITAMDALRVAAAGAPLDVEIIENDAAIEITYSHRFAIQGTRFVVTAYADERETTYDSYPVHRIQTLIRKAHKHLSPEILESVHLPNK